MHRFARHAALLTAALIVLAGQPASAYQLAHDQIVSAVPSTATPDISDGYPNAIVKIGNRVLVGGTFSGDVTDRSTGTVHHRPYLFSFDPQTGLVDPNFAPTISAEVRTLIPGPIPGTVYVGGRMNSVNGVAGYHKLVLLQVADGSLVTSFRAPSMNGVVNTVALVGDRLLVGGAFTRVGGVEHGGLVALDPLTGDRLDYVDIHLTENHNYDGVSGAQAPVGATTIKVAPDGQTAVVIGNFKRANGLDRDQILMLDLVEPQAEIRDWHTDHYKPACLRNSYDRWVRDVAYSPDGSFFVVATTGGPIRNTLCDTAARWETAATGSNLNPTWVTWTGGDTLLSVAVTETAVYVGGHQRWMNNHWGRDNADTGAVARPGIAALDPTSGVPLSWNPGRHPRGYGATVIYPTPEGIYVGSDTKYIGNREYRRERLAFFPLAGGTVPPRGESATLPADIHFTNVPVDVGLGLPDIFYRVNAGGEEIPAIDDGPNWAADMSDPSPYRNSGSSRSWYTPPIPSLDDSVPATTPVEVFGSRRWDPPADPEMHWSFPVPEGLPVEVRLYLAERTWSHNQPGSRVFDIVIDGTVAVDGFDAAAQVGYNTGMMVAVPIISDGMVDIELIREVSDPSIFGIEIMLDDDGSLGTAPGIVKHSFDGTTLGPEVPVGGADGTDWSQLRGAFLVDDMLFYGMSDGSFWRRSYDGVTIGMPELLTPHLDPYWDGVPTGSGTSTYDGRPTTGFATAMASMRAMYFADGRIFYTRAGSNNLYWRWFNPENGLAGSREFSLPGSTGLNQLSNTSGVLFLSEGYVYWSRADNGQLVRRPIVDNGPGTEQVTTASSATRGLVWGGPAEVVSGPNIDGVDWRTPGAFLRADD